MKRGLLIILFCVLLLPYLQHRFSIFPQGELHGYFSCMRDTVLTPSTWFSGSYQERINGYYNDRIGFRPELLRINSQIDYSLFHKVTFGGTVLGKDNYLYYQNYVDAYYGRDYVGEHALRERMYKLRCLQDTFAALGKTLVLVVAPCKVWYYPEYLPQNKHIQRGSGNNYLSNVHMADSLGINTLDFNSWFLALKGKTPGRLYSRQGIHWTNYGSILAADSLAGYIGRLRGRQLSRPAFTRLTYTTQAIDPDNDMLFVLNLLFPVVTDTLCYPAVSWPPKSSVAHPRCIVVGDSYVMNFLKTQTFQHIFGQWQFWFYFRNLVTVNNYKNPDLSGKVADSNWQGALTDTDCIILMYTPMNHAHLGNGFIEQAYDTYFPSRLP